MDALLRETDALEVLRKRDATERVSASAMDGTVTDTEETQRKHESTI